MKIARVRAWRIGADLRTPFAFSQWQFRRRETTLVSVTTADGLTGWGEAYGPTAPAAAAIENFFAPLITGRDPRDTESLWHLLYARSIDYGQKGTMLAAISGLDIAFWDLKAQSAGMPLYRVLGGEHTETIPCYATGFYFGGDEPQARGFAREAEQYLAQGFRAMKMKVGLGVEADAVLVKAVRNAIGTDVRLMVDANHAYTPAEAIALGRRIEPLGIHWFEEPVSPLDLDGYLMVKQSIGIPLAGGETEFTRFGFEPLLRRRAVDYAQPDLCSTGGISEGLKIAALCSIYNVHLTPHVWGSAIGAAAALHFYAARPRHPATLTVEDKLIECDRTESPFRYEVVDNPPLVENGMWAIPQGPGLGLQVNQAAVERFLIR